MTAPPNPQEAYGPPGAGSWGPLQAEAGPSLPPSHLGRHKSSLTSNPRSHVKCVYLKDKWAHSALGHLNWVLFNDPGPSRKPPTAGTSHHNPEDTHTHSHTHRGRVWQSGRPQPPPGRISELGPPPDPATHSTLPPKSQTALLIPTSPDKISHFLVSLEGRRWICRGLRCREDQEAAERSFISGCGVHEASVRSMGIWGLESEQLTEGTDFRPRPEWSTGMVVLQLW